MAWDRVTEGVGIAKEENPKAHRWREPHIRAEPRREEKRREEGSRAQEMSIPAEPRAGEKRSAVVR